MARQNHTSKKSRTTVPVVSRATRQREAAAKAKAKGRRNALSQWAAWILLALP